MHQARPTDYAGIRFRSRAEARWAAFFDEVGWSWLYEPLDLSGYIPDFILQFKRPLLVEVKGGALRLEHMEADALPKVLRSGWRGDSLVVGAGPLPGREHTGEGLVLGLHHQPRGLNEVDDDKPCAPGVLSQCKRCRSLIVVNLLLGWRCDECGDIGEDVLRAAPDHYHFGLEAWRRASARLSWDGDRRARRPRPQRARTP